MNVLYYGDNLGMLRKYIPDESGSLGVREFAAEELLTLEQPSCPWMVQPATQWRNQR